MHLYENRSRFSWRGIVLSVLIFVLAAGVFVGMLGQIETKSSAQQTQVLENAIRRAAITCYAIEGRYPPTLDYILENYGVIVDDEKYIVSYRAFASNIMPNIDVLIKGASSS